MAIVGEMRGFGSKEDAIAEREVPVAIQEQGGWSHALGSDRRRRHRPSGPRCPL